MRSATHRLSLHAETVRRLDAVDIAAAWGGSPQSIQISACFTCDAGAICNLTNQPRCF